MMIHTLGQRHRKQQLQSDLRLLEQDKTRCGVAGVVGTVFSHMQAASLHSVLDIVMPWLMAVPIMATSAWLGSAGCQ
jgi:hypothetical protein